jgi:uncharacterized protein YkwD
MKKLLIAFGLLSCIHVLPQNQVWEKWDKDVVEKANTAKDFEYYNEEEKKVVLFMNLARINGPLFAETFLNEYVTANNIKKNSYLNSLYRDLKKTKDLTPLIPEEDLTSIAQKYAKDGGEAGWVGHKNFDKRFKPFMKNPYWGVAENCSYGYQNAIDIVISLLIDDGVKSLGQRINTLKPEFNSVGVAIRPHKNYTYNCVIDFGKQDRSDLNAVPSF